MITGHLNASTNSTTLTDTTSEKGVWRRIFEAMSDDPDFEYLIVDSTIIRAHQHAAGAKKGGLKIRPLAAPAVA